jgi:hypothetical protein
MSVIEWYVCVRREGGKEGAGEGEGEGEWERNLEVLISEFCDGLFVLLVEENDAVGKGKVDLVQDLGFKVWGFGV